MKIVVFSKDGEIYAPKRIVEEGRKRGHEIANLFYSRLAIEIVNNQVKILYDQKPLPDFEAYVLRVSGMGLAGPLYVYQRVGLINYLPDRAKVVNRKTYLKYPRLNKLEQHYELARAKVPVVPSLTYSSPEIIDWDRFSYPLIAKTIYGSSGVGVFKLDNQGELEDLINEKGINNLMFQTFLPTRQDFRVIAIGGQALPLAMRKTATGGDFRTNYAQGGKVEGVPLTIEMKRLAEETARVFLADYAGVDIMYDADHRPYVLEINRGAQFQGFEQSTNLSVPEFLLDYLEQAV